MPELALATLPTFRELFEAHAAYVWRVLRALGVAERDVDDLCQEVFVVIHRKLSTYNGQCALRTWVYGICLRTASDHRRRARVRYETVTDAPPEETVGAEQHDQAERQQARAALGEALDRLDDDKRAVFVLYEIEELSLNEIAKVVGCPLQTAYSRLTAARSQVKQAVLRWEQKRGAP